MRTLFATLVLAAGCAGDAPDLAPSAAPAVDPSKFVLPMLSADQRARRESGAELLTSSRIAATPSARRELTAGLVDSRLLVTIAALAGQRPVKILGFGHSGPGVTPATSPLRSVELTQMPGGRQLPRAEFLRSTLAFLRAQRSPFYASGVQEIRMTGGGTALRVIFSAPSPLGLLSGAVATPPGG